MYMLYNNCYVMRLYYIIYIISLYVYIYCADMSSLQDVRKILLLCKIQF